jgi:serine/threonine-protein kinase
VPESKADSLGESRAPDNDATLKPTVAGQVMATGSFVVAGNPPADSTVTRGATAASDDQPLPSMPGYRFVKQLGEGGMGVVYEAVNLLDRRVAVKFMRSLRGGREYHARFRKEAAALLDLDHPHIARFFEYGEHENRPFFTMRLLAGGTLAERSELFRGDPRATVELMAKVADAVGYVHRQNLLHRDLKPSNILFDDEGRPFVTDFGLVRDYDPELTASKSSNPDIQRQEPATTAADPAASTLTNPGRAMGTLPYMAPEQVRGESAGPWTDVWALGIILYELLTGERPFECADLASMQARLRAGPVRSPGAINPQLDAEIERITLKCLQLEPAMRFRNADELAQALRGWLQKNERKPTRIRLVAAGIFLVAVLVIAAAIAHFTGPDDPQRQFAKQINRGETVVLLGEQGDPARHTVVRGVGVTEWHYESDNTYSIDSQRDAAIEIFPNPLCDRYRFRAQVRHNRLTGNRSRVGIFVMRRMVGEAPDQKMAMITLTISMDDRDLKAASGPRNGISPLLAASAELNLNWYHTASSKYGQTLLRALPHVVYTPNERLVNPWQELVLDVSPERVSAKWGDREIAPVSLGPGPNLPAAVKMQSVKPSDLDSRGGLGFFVTSGSASFKNASIQPLTRNP